MKIIVDAMGGDHAPLQIVSGAVDALNRDKNLTVVLVGDENAINKSLAECKEYDKNRLDIIDAKDVITNDDTPTTAIRTKKESSLVKAFDALVHDDEAGGFVSAGSTGAVLVGAYLKVGRIKGVTRPALAPVLPTLKGNGVVLCDCGANVDCKPSYLQQFAVMASAYMHDIMGVENPRVGLLNNGAEAEKGNELTKAAYKLLEQTPVNFVGNCEAREILSGDFDAIVCDGFAGNIVLKYTEGLAATFIGMLKKELMADTRSKLGAAMAKPAFRRFKKVMDYTEYGGAPLLGIDGGVIKAHGSSTAKAFAAALGQARSFASSGTNETIRRAVKSLPEVPD